ncbi:MAG: NAD(P)/FAD-dependent oxidoreductase [Chitinophagaceae bacterium]
MKKVVIVGGGFAGLNLAKSLEGNPYYQVTIVDQNNYHFFPPLLYQVSTAFIEASNITYPFRRMFQGKANLKFYMGSLVNIDMASNTIKTDTGTLSYDYLVLALGTETNYFGIENVKQKALPMKTIDDALHLRNHILLTLEKAVRSQDLQEKEKLASIVIAGGGPTGVEIAGMLAEMGRNIVSKDYPEATPGVGKIYLVDAGPTLLGPMSKKSQEEAYSVLRKLGVQIFLNTAVKDYLDDKVVLANGESISTGTLVWASGVVAREAPGLAKESFTSGRRIRVDEYNRVEGTANIFAIGDQCFQASDKNFPGGHPQLAQVAIQQGKLLASNFKNMAESKVMKAFVYNDKGSMAIIAKFKAVVDLPKGFFKGFLAWLVWLFIHIIPIAGFRNKAKLAFNWFWSFVTNDPTLRLIIRPDKKSDT